MRGDIGSVVSWFPLFLATCRSVIIVKHGHLQTYRRQQQHCALNNSVSPVYRTSTWFNMPEMSHCLRLNSNITYPLQEMTDITLLLLPQGLTRAAGELKPKMLGIE